MIRDFILWNGMLENVLTLWNFKAGKSTSELRFVYEQPILRSPCSGSKKLRLLNQLTNSVNKLARAITKWTRACDKRLARLISHVHHTSEFEQYCHVGNTAEQCRSGLFQDSDFAGDLDDPKSKAGGLLCIFGSHTFVPTSWMCKKQTSVSHSSTEADIISLDAGLRMDGIPALNLWDLVTEVFHFSPKQTHKTKYVRESR